MLGELMGERKEKAIVRKSVLLFLICGLVFQFNRIEASDLLTTALKGGLTIQALSLGGAYSAQAMGSGSIYYNPSGLAVPGGLYRYEVYDYKNTLYQNYFAHLLYASPFGFANWKVQDLQNNAVEVYSVGYGRKGKKGIDWGVTYKMIYERYNSYERNSWSSDIGLLMHFTPNINFSLVARDIFKNVTDLPTSFVVGGSVFSVNRDFVVVSDLEIDRSKSEIEYNTHFGLEYNVSNGLILRSGIYKDMLSGGVQISLPFAQIEYGVIYSQNQKNETLNMLGFRLGKGIVSKKNHQRYALFKPKTYAKFAIGGNLSHGKSEISLLGGAKIGSNDLLSLIHLANKDDYCEGYIMRIGSLSNSLSTIGLVQEIRQELQKAKKKNKKVIAYIEHWATLPEYYLASVADTIILPELGTISHLGLDLEILKTKEFLNNFGINTAIITSGQYKDNTNPEADDLTEPEKLMLENLVGNLYHQVLFDIKEARGINWADMSEVFDGRIISAEDALAKGLVDKLGYWPQIEKMIKKEKEEKEERYVGFVNLQEHYNVFESEAFLIPFNRIAVVEIDGSIALGNSQTNFLFGGKQTGADHIDQLLEKIRKDFSIKGVIIRVNSVGGGLMASDRIYNAIEILKKSGKKVYTSMGTVAASGGYYVSLNSDKILANPGTLTGSIGVISAFKNYADLHRILGIKSEVIKTGKYMDMFSANRELTEEEVAMVSNYQESQFNHFTDKLVKNRKFSKEEVADIAQGQLFTGEQAKELKIIDELGNFYDAVDALAKEIKVKDPELVFYREKPNFFLSLFDPNLLRFFF
jgi:protease-4